MGYYANPLLLETDLGFTVDSAFNPQLRIFRPFPLGLSIAAEEWITNQYLKIFDKQKRIYEKDRYNPG